MALKDFVPLKLKFLRLRRLVLGNRRRKRRESTKLPWMTPISHGHKVVETDWYRSESDSGESDFDSVVVQTEQVDELELWFFGASDNRVGDALADSMQTLFFDSKPKSQVRRKAKEAMRKAYLDVKVNIRDDQIVDETSKIPGSVSAILIGGDKLVIANVGGYEAVLCRDGVARRINGGADQKSGKRHWSRRLFSGCHTGNVEKSTRSKSSEVVVGTERVDSATEFLILASTGIWEAMKPQEAVNLIGHLMDPREAAECLAREAIARVSRSNISCVVIRFD